MTPYNCSIFYNGVIFVYIIIIPIAKLIRELRSKSISFHPYSLIFSVFFFELIE
nr:MAG TPA: hypothetical protein [Bacteriophage sp.]